MQFKEWATILLVLGFLVSISLIAAKSELSAPEQRTLEKHPLKPKALVVTFQGAVVKPGAYTCRPGIGLKELLKEAGIASNAHRKMIPFKKVIYSSQTIEIPQKTQGKKISLEEK